MPSPIAHSAMAYAIYRFSRRSRRLPDQFKRGGLPKLLLISIFLSLLPDIDVIPGILLGNFGDYHNHATHSLIVGLALATGFGLWAWRRKLPAWREWSLIFFASYSLHVIMDYFTFGRGEMLIWPFSDQRFIASVKLFYGFHWSDGLFSLAHVWTVVTELLFSFILISLVFLVEKFREGQKRGWQMDSKARNEGPYFK